MFFLNGNKKGKIFLKRVANWMGKEYLVRKHWK